MALVSHECSEPPGDLTPGVAAVCLSPELHLEPDEGKSMCSKALSALGVMSLEALYEPGTDDTTTPGVLEIGIGVCGSYLVSENAHELSAGVSHSDVGRDVVVEPTYCMSKLYPVLECVEYFVNFKLPP